MNKFKCTNCGYEFKDYGIIDIYSCRWKTAPVPWPFQEDTIATCPSCNKLTRILIITSKKVKIITIIVLIMIPIVIFLSILIQFL